MIFSFIFSTTILLTLIPLLTLALLLTLILPYLANHTNFIGKLYARFFIWLQESCNLCLIRSRLPSIGETNKDAHTFIGSYTRWFYSCMCLDKYRMGAYKKAIAKIANDSKYKSYNWIDIGTGADMPLSRLLLDSKVANHIHAIESNQDAYLSAKNIKSSLEKKRGKNLITLYSCYSTDLSPDIDPQPTAIVHEIVGTVSSSEGAVSSVLGILRKFPNISQLVPYRFGTLCVPVSWPITNLSSSMASLLYGGSWSISRESGIQCLYNPTKTWMAEPQLIEDYTLPLLKAMTKTKEKDSDPIKTIVQIPITRRDICCGLYLSPLIQCGPDSSDNSIESEINGMKSKTNWGIEFVCFGNDKALWLDVGDVLEVGFTANVAESCPSYHIDVILFRSSCSHKQGQSIFSLDWKGPQDNMMIRIFGN